jgi:allophanate hydrolase
MLQHGISESGPMDRGAFRTAGAALGVAGAAIEFTRAGLDFSIEQGGCRAGFAGGSFALAHNGTFVPWPALLELQPGDQVSITPGAGGNYGYLRFDQEIDVPAVLGSRSTNLVAALGGLAGRALRAGDGLGLTCLGPATTQSPSRPPNESGPIRFLWGIHADLFPPAVRQAFVGSEFTVSSQLDRMGVRLDDRGGVFAGAPILSLVSDAIVAGDIQILGDRTPIVLMRDHQPTGGYPRIGTVISADLDRFAQMRPGSTLAFAPVTLQKAHELFVASVP